MSRLLVSLVFLLIGYPICSAQEAKSPPRTLRLLAVGEAPPFRQEIRNGVRYELPPPKGAIPPVRLEVSVFNKEGDKEKSQYEVDNAENPGLRLKLNNVSSRLLVPGSELQVRLLEDGTTWHTVKLPEGGDYLLVLWRDPEVKKWSKARSFLVKDGGANFQAGDLRLINVGPVSVGYEIQDEEQFVVPRGKTVVKSLGVTAGTPTKVSYQDGKGKWRRLWSSALVQNQGERSTVVVYFADGEKPRRPLKLIALRERAVPLPKVRPGRGVTTQ